MPFLAFRVVSFLFLCIEILPLVEFHPEVDISDSEAERLVMAPPNSNENQGDPFNEVNPLYLIMNTNRRTFRVMTIGMIMFRMPPPVLYHFV